MSTAGGSISLGVVADLWDKEHHQIPVAFIVFARYEFSSRHDGTFRNGRLTIAQCGWLDYRSDSGWFY